MHPRLSQIFHAATGENYSGYVRFPFGRDHVRVDDVIELLSGFWPSHLIELNVESFVDGNFESEFYTFIRPDQEQLRKMQLHVQTL
jgi:hypothetical protein